MAFVINPDGTISTVETEYDRYGNVKPKINCDLLKEQEINYNSNLAPKTEIAKAKTIASKKKSNVNRSNHSKGKIFISTAEIELFFKDRIAARRGISIGESQRIANALPKELREYFIYRYNEYLAHGKRNHGGFRERFSFKKPKNKKKPTKKNKSPHVVKNVYKSQATRTGYSLGEIATFSPLNKQTPDGDMVNGRSLLGASRKPKYGYARDRYGRVQERDSFNEERKNEFKQSQKQQSSYDYSSFDAEDDHDSYYDSNGYE